ncbi:MAG: hypothetical protein DDT42_02008 [candidate division WS2 bacterium]|uniref:Uncharacterized protein n=1 Tax=Psychracetigena formicireducens TaxID=2986056 RepID=A0A9E2F5F0_PSYF1|nr:hypothetical protein [Candidatus Psychracetigena formicireducens]
MPQYKSSRQLKKVSLPSVEGSEIEIYSSLLFGDLERIYESEKSDIAKATEALVSLIKDWNLTDEQGQKLPISVETIRTFEMSDVTFLLGESDLGDKKKVNLPE